MSCRVASPCLLLFSWPFCCCCQLFVTTLDLHYSFVSGTHPICQYSQQFVLLQQRIPCDAVPIEGE
eukprot:m.212066 g.212066  ORF g.212066 m.212066 type:complete len:66 (+) comp15069_c0_seq1:2364-2561(+)